MVGKRLAALLVVLIATLAAVPAQAAQAASPQVFVADLNSVFPPPATGTQVGNALLLRAGKQDRWVGGVLTKGLPVGNYSYAVLIGTDFNGDGFPDGFSFFTLCTFVVTGNAPAGCHASPASLGRTELGPFASAQVIRTGMSTFLKATGPLRPVA